MLWRWRKERERELERELRSDFELEAAEQQKSGLPPDAAFYAAHRAFGNLGLIKEEVRQVWGWMFLDRLKQDLVYALRAMRRSPGFSATAVLSLALGIGANTAIFSLIDAVLLRWLPVRDPQGLIQVIIRRPGTVPLESFAYPLVPSTGRSPRDLLRSLRVQHQPASCHPLGRLGRIDLRRPGVGRLLHDAGSPAGHRPVAGRIR